jgi:hypothetical protein
MPDSGVLFLFAAGGKKIAAPGFAAWAADLGYFGSPIAGNREEGADMPAFVKLGCTQ